MIDPSPLGRQVEIELLRLEGEKATNSRTVLHVQDISTCIIFAEAGENLASLLAAGNIS